MNDKLASETATLVVVGGGGSLLDSNHGFSFARTDEHQTLLDARQALAWRARAHARAMARAPVPCVACRHFGTRKL